MSKNYKDKARDSYPKSSGSTLLGIDFGDNKEQLDLIRLMNENSTPVIFCEGLAGTGKTFTAVAASIDLVKIKRKYSKIFYIREPVEVGHSLGFLPGELDDKYGVYLEGLQDNIDHISYFSGINPNDLKSNIDCIPPEFIRGRSFENSIIIADEAQNFNLDTIQTMMTRIGAYCKIVFLGSVNQIDVKGMTSDKNDFTKAYDIVKNTGFVGYVHLVKSERSVYATTLDEAFDIYKKTGVAWGSDPNKGK
jgi:PhoH-like ATPase